MHQVRTPVSLPVAVVETIHQKENRRITDASHELALSKKGPAHCLASEEKMNSIPRNLTVEQAETITTLLQHAKRLLRDAASPMPISTPGNYSVIAQRIGDMLRVCGVEE